MDGSRGSRESSEGSQISPVEVTEGLSDDSSEVEEGYNEHAAPEAEEDRITLDATTERIQAEFQSMLRATFSPEFLNIPGTPTFHPGRAQGPTRTSIQTSPLVAQTQQAPVRVDAPVPRNNPGPSRDPNIEEDEYQRQSWAHREISQIRGSVEEEERDIRQRQESLRREPERTVLRQRINGEPQELTMVGGPPPTLLAAQQLLRMALDLTSQLSRQDQMDLQHFGQGQVGTRSDPQDIQRTTQQETERNARQGQMNPTWGDRYRTGTISESRQARFVRRADRGPGTDDSTVPGALQSISTVQGHRDREFHNGGLAERVDLATIAKEAQARVGSAAPFSTNETDVMPFSQHQAGQSFSRGALTTPEHRHDTPAPGMNRPAPAPPILGDFDRFREIAYSSTPSRSPALSRGRTLGVSSLPTRPTPSILAPLPIVTGTQPLPAQQFLSPPPHTPAVVEFLSGNSPMPVPRRSLGTGLGTLGAPSASALGLGLSENPVPRTGGTGEAPRDDGRAGVGQQEPANIVTRPQETEENAQ